MNLNFFNNEKKDEDYLVTFNDILVGNAYVSSFENQYTVSFNSEIVELSSEYTFEDFFKLNIESFNIPIDIDNFKNLSWIDNEQSTFWCDLEFICTLSLMPHFLNWNKSVDISTFTNLLKEKLNNKEITFLNTNIIEEGIYVTSKINSNKNIISEYQRILGIVDFTIEKIFSNYNQEKSNNHITNSFSFPPEIRSSCEQYLIYFSKFLEDLGIEVTSKLDSQAETTLFTVIPKNSEEALSNIKELLNTYLKLPEANDIERLSSNYSDVSVQQLIANIFHLKSQLMLSNSIIQNKDATIESLKFTNYQQNQILNSKSNQNDEKTLNGLVTLTEYEGKGFKINLAEIFRRLKRQLKK